MQLPSKTKNTDGPLPWSVTWQASDGRMTVTLNCELPKAELSLAETEAFQRAVRDLVVAVGEPATFSLINNTKEQP